MIDMTDEQAVAQALITEARIELDYDRMARAAIACIRARDRERAGDQLTLLLCEACWLIDYQYPMSPALRSWWKQNQDADRKRKLRQMRDTPHNLRRRTSDE